jgi:hypothetical protein
MKTPLTGKRACWLLTETRKGWRISLEVGKKSYPLRGAVFPDQWSAVEALDDLNLVFVHLGGEK